jgi:hypothetical protein
VGGIPLWTDPIKLVTFYRDTDGDGYGNNDEQLIVLSGTGAPNGYIGNYTDCDDNDATINPDTVWYTGVDTDGDTFFGSTTSLIQCESPGAVYVRIAPTTPDCDDTALGGAIFNPNTVWYIGVDADNDTYIGSVAQVIQCESPGVDYALIAPTIEDCNDGDASISPTAVWYADIDGDGFGDINTSETGCTPTLANATQDNTDCDDNDSSANDIDGVWYLDFDNDGYATSTVTLCNSPGTGYTNTAMPLGDCNDADNTINPGVLEISGDGIDNNCDDQIDEAQIGQFRGAGVVFWVDPADNYKGLVCAIEDQNSGSKIRWSNGSTINTGATETAIGSGLANTDAIILAQGATETSYAAGIARAYTGGGFNDWFLPSKDELYQMVVHRAIINSTANSNAGANFPIHVWSSTQHHYSYGYAWIMDFIGGYQNLKNIESSPNFVRAVRVFDCNDNDAHRVWYLDADGDNYAVSTTTQCASPGLGYTQTALSLGDCNDNDATINPDTVWYLDADGDNYAKSKTSQQCNTPGAGYITNVLPLGDCNDNDAEINPNTVWYLDADGDNYAVSTTTQCDPGAGYTTTVLPFGDCDDTLASSNPGLTEILSNGIDDDCNWDTGDVIYTVNTFYAELGGYVIEVSHGGSHGLVVAMRDQGWSSWDDARNTFLNNTANHDADGGEFKDWRLPAIGELNLVRSQRINIGGFDSGYNKHYWSSSFRDYIYAYGLDWMHGTWRWKHYRYDAGIVRAVRAF